MADIKTKDNAKGTIRTIDKAAVATQRMKQAYIATKEKAERSVNANSSSAEEYASETEDNGQTVRMNLRPVQSSSLTGRATV